MIGLRANKSRQVKALGKAKSTAMDAANLRKSQVDHEIIDCFFPFFAEPVRPLT
jgi:hypothetical protein